MTSIAWDGNGPVFKNGAVGTEQACCCEQQYCCFTDINCDIVVTVTYSNGQTRTNGQYQIGYDGNDTVFVVDYIVESCNQVRFTHSEQPYFATGDLFPCYQVATKTQAINCTTCCEDGTACDCIVGDAINENYAPYGPVVCTQNPTTIHVTGISITLANCGDCPCEFP